ncbi:doublecortin domain-containing protein 2B [Anguilla anguilla]|uniref:doublecortin domain-containing protein 2B n=1 Tax=Anguilla anguilla TaxID=7936 RepID=UPI0015A8075D|nr:doublecortin domain-containing protein 2B [Anguilla anguilla]
MGTQGPAVLPPVKSVMVYRNGDPFFPGRRFVVNHRQVANLECFLSDVTQSIRAPVAMRTLYTPGAGHRVRELEELRSGAQYVAAGFERFKKLDYTNTGPKPVARRSDRAQVRAVQRPNVSAKWRKAIHLPCIIHVFRNGDLLCPPMRFILPRSTLQDLEQILSMVSEKASLRTGAVRRLCTLEGGAVSAGEELESGQYYVAVGTERFKKLPYVELLVPKAAAAHGHRNHYGDRRLPKRYESRKPVSVPQDRYSDSTLLDSPEGDGRRVKSTGDEAGGPAPTRGAPKKQGRAPKEEESLFFAKPAKVHKNKAAPRYSRPLRGDAHPSVFKGDVRKRRKEVQGAEEVAEDEDTAVEFPVDQRAAETVEDEELDDKRHVETPREDSPDLRREREKTSAEPRFEVGYETNRSTPPGRREINGRASSAFNEEKQEPAAPHFRDSARRSSGDFEEADSAREESSQAEQTKPPKSAAGSLTYRSHQDLPEAGKLRPDSRLSTNELAA